MKVGDILRRVHAAFFGVVCRHEFDLTDLHQTGIKEPERPADGASFDAHMKWHQSLYTGPWYTERVEWSCAKCGKVFRAHCGLDISPKHGFIRARRHA